MLILTPGSFLGETELVRAGGLLASLSHYPSTAPYDEPPHCHETMHLSMILRGGNIEKRGADAAESLPGTITLYKSGEEHYSVNIVPNSCQVNLEITDEFLEAHNVTAAADRLENCDPADLRLLMLKVYKEFTAGDPDLSLTMSSDLLSVLSLSGNARLGLGTPAWITPVKEMLHDLWNEPVTLDELATVAGLHPANLSGYFPRYFGCTVGEYRRKLKVKKALELVRSGTLSLTAIAHVSGFADQSHFTRVCKELTGWNPKQLKRMRLLNAGH